MSSPQALFKRRHVAIIVTSPRRADVRPGISQTCSLLFATRFATSGLRDATSQKIANGTYFPVEQVSDLRMGAGQAAVRVMIQCKL